MDYTITNVTVCSDVRMIKISKEVRVLVLLDNPTM